MNPAALFITAAALASSGASMAQIAPPSFGGSSSPQPMPKRVSVKDYEDYADYADQSYFERKALKTRKNPELRQDSFAAKAKARKHSARMEQARERKQANRMG